MSNPNDTTHAEPVRDRMIRKPRGNGEHFYWRCPGEFANNGWVAQRSLGTRFAAAEVDAALRDILPEDLPHIRVVRLKPKAAPPVETPTTETAGLLWLDILSGEKSGDRIRVSALIPPGLSREVKVGDRIAIESTMFRGGSGVLTVTEINGTLAQCSSHP